MDFFLTLGLVLLSVFTTFGALRRGADTAGWEWRWRSLDPEERSRIAAAATSTSKAERATLVDPEEVELGAGYRRRQRRRRAYFEMPVLTLLLVLAALTLTGFVSGSFFGFIGAMSILADGVVTRLFDRRTNGQRRVSVDPGATI